MFKEMLGVFYFVLSVYRAADLICDWYCLTHFKDSVMKIMMLATCIVGTPFNVWYLRRAIIKTFHMVGIPLFGRMSNSNDILPELNFHVIEVIVNFAQIVLGGRIEILNINNGCYDPKNLDLAYCCCCGALFQVICFFKNVVCSREKGRTESAKRIHVVGLVGSLISALIECFLIAFTFFKELRTC